MKIAVLQRIKETQYGQLNYYITKDNVKMFENKGVFLMAVSSTVDLDFVVETCDGLYVPGGEDIDPHFYNEEINGSRNIIREVDEADLIYIKAFHKAKKPILGICRGLQVVNVYFGGTLYQDIKNHENVWHDVLIDENSFVYDIYETNKLHVNSYHHQAIKDVAPGFRVVAKAEDGTIEAIEKDNIYLVQWHPEMYDGSKFIDYFIKKVF